METIGVVLNMISANMRTEELLQQSQRLTQELQTQSKELTQQQDELKRTNAALEKQAIELEEKARLLAEQNTQGRGQEPRGRAGARSLEEKAEQLALISKYKSEFLANMSHELRTPLNSLLILAKLLSDNKDTNLSAKQVEYAKTIYASGGDLLTLINEILDLSKVEAGKMQVEPRDVALAEVSEFVERTFRAGGRAEGPGVQHRGRPRRCRRAHPHRPAAAAAGPQEPALQRLQVHRARHRSAARCTGPSRGTRFANETLRDGERRRLLRRGHRHRHRARQAAAHLRGVPAGRRHHQPQVRRHGPGAVDQPRDRAPARRRDPRRERARQGQHVHALPARALRRRPRRRGIAGGRGWATAREPSFAARGQRRRRWREPGPDRHAADRGRPRAHPRGRPGAAHHRGRREVRAHHAGDGARAAASRPWSRPAATPAWRSPTSSARRHHARHPAARCSTAGRCSTA